MKYHEIIINGKSSRLVKGLLIMDTGSIIKPKQRINQIEIKGKDGDIIERQGYEAYDREIQVGLYRDFNIDEVIAFFNTEGEVVIPPEYDKVYSFTFYDEVALDRLFRYRTASFYLHLQPYKYARAGRQRTFAQSYSGEASFEVMNAGNVYSQPQVILDIRNTFPSGDYYIKMGTLSEITLSGTLIAYSVYSVTLDPLTGNAWDTDTGNFVNSYVTGDIFKDIALPTGATTVVTRYINSVTLIDFSRWI